MPMVEVDEAEFLRAKQTRDLLGKMLANPEARRKVLEAHKTIDPNMVIPELDAAKPVQEGLAAIQKQMSDFIDAQTKAQKERDDAAKKDKFVSDFEKGRAMLRSTYGVTDEGLIKVEELMTKAGIVDHEIGFAAFTQLNPEPAPVPPSPNFGFGGIFNVDAKNPDEFLKAMHASKGNDNAALDKHIHEIIQDVRAKSGTPAPQPQQGFGRR